MLILEKIRSLMMILARERERDGCNFVKMRKTRESDTIDQNAEGYKCKKNLKKLTLQIDQEIWELEMLIN